ncbi:MAG: DNA-binding protein [Planctomycetota bacterium]|nr:MAG: DNA-binding protein [Planctomycetota bacterium]
MDQDIFIISQRIKARRLEKGLKVTEIANRCGLSKSVISKIENNRTIPSLPVLLKISKALEIDPSEIVGGISVNDNVSFEVIRKENQKTLLKEEGKGFFYQNIINFGVQEGMVEATILTIEPNAKRNMVTTDGYEFIYVINGSMVQKMGDTEVELETGDSLYFNGRVPHVPRSQGNASVTLICLYFLQQS